MVLYPDRAWLPDFYFAFLFALFSSTTIQKPLDYGSPILSLMQECTTSSKKSAVNYFDAKPWELIKVYGKLVAGLVILGALTLTFIRKNSTLPNLIGSMLILLTGYYFLSSTVHPWYIAFLVTLSMFTRYQFAVLWSFLVILSYFAYANPRLQGKSMVACH